MIKDNGCVPLSRRRRLQNVIQDRPDVPDIAQIDAARERKVRREFCYKATAGLVEEILVVCGREEAELRAQLRRDLEMVGRIVASTGRVG